VLPGRPGRRIRGNPQPGQLAKKLLIEAIFIALNPATGVAAASSPAEAWETPARCHTLGLYGFNQGGGLDFVWQREYGRFRWLENPAETNKYR
jgi:hypothetical protein